MIPEGSTTGRLKASPYSMALASIYFPRAAHFLAECYDQIATDSVRKCVVEQKDAIGGFDELSNELLEYRIAITGEIAGEAYW